MLGVFLTVGWSFCQIFRYGVRFLLPKIPVRGYGTILTGILSTVAALIGLGVLATGYLPAGDTASWRELALVLSIGLTCGLFGGAFGSLEATNRE